MTLAELLEQGTHCLACGERSDMRRGKVHYTHQISGAQAIMHMDCFEEIPAALEMLRSAVGIHPDGSDADTKEGRHET